MKKSLLISLLICFIPFIGAYGQCYLDVENSTNLDTQSMSRIAKSKLSQYFEPLSEIPPKGIGENDCVYNLEVSGISEGVFLTIKGQGVSTYGDSSLAGFDGFQQALYLAIINQKPETKSQICQRNYRLLTNECGSIEEPSGFAPKGLSKGKLVVKVPYDYRYAYIESAGSIIGKMNGEETREFELDTGVTHMVKAVDGIYESEEIHTTLQSGATTRISFKNFRAQEETTSKEAVISTPSQKTASGATRRKTSTFGENGTFLLGISYIPYYTFSYQEKDAGLNSSDSFKGVDTGSGLDVFFDVYFNRFLGIGADYVLVLAQNDSKDKKEHYQVATISTLLTASLWIPLGSTSSLHLGAKGGYGVSSYKLTWFVNDSEVATFESEGVAAMGELFFDWGGDAFGARAGYKGIWTDLSNSEQTSYSSSTYKRTGKYLADTSGSGYYASIRWAF